MGKIRNFSIFGKKTNFGSKEQVKFSLMFGTAYNFNFVLFLLE